MILIAGYILCDSSSNFRISVVFPELDTNNNNRVIVPICKYVPKHLRKLGDCESCSS